MITRFRMGAKAEEPRKQRIKECRRGRRRRQETEERGRRGGSRAEERESETQLKSTGRTIRLFDSSTWIRFLSFRTRNHPHEDTDPVPAVSELTRPLSLQRDCIQYPLSIIVGTMAFHQLIRIRALRPLHPTKRRRKGQSKMRWLAASISLLIGGGWRVFGSLRCPFVALKKSTRVKAWSVYLLPFCYRITDTRTSHTRTHQYDTCILVVLTCETEAG